VEQAQDPPWQCAVADDPHCVSAVHGPQTPATHASLLPQSLFEEQAGVQMPEAQASPGAQSLLAEHVQCTVECVATHSALGPH
jgi:hypothetical protein